MNEPDIKEVDATCLGQALLTLAREVWVLRDRQRILEAVLEDKGLLEEALLDQYQPDEKLAAALREERQQYLDNLVNALTRKKAD